MTVHSKTLNRSTSTAENGSIAITSTRAHELRPAGPDRRDDLLSSRPQPRRTRHGVASTSDLHDVRRMRTATPPSVEFSHGLREAYETALKPSGPVTIRDLLADTFGGCDFGRCWPRTKKCRSIWGGSRTLDHGRTMTALPQPPRSLSKAERGTRRRDRARAETIQRGIARMEALVRDLLDTASLQREHSPREIMLRGA